MLQLGLSTGADVTCVTCGGGAPAQSGGGGVREGFQAGGTLGLAGASQPGEAGRAWGAGGGAGGRFWG